MVMAVVVELSSAEAGTSVCDDGVAGDSAAVPFIDHCCLIISLINMPFKISCVSADKIVRSRNKEVRNTRVTSC